MSSFFVYLALGYWGLCVAVVIGLLFLRCPDESDETLAELVRSVPSPRREFGLAFAATVIVLFAPLLTPYCLITGILECRREAAKLRSLSRSHRENVYARIHPVHLPKIARQYFEEMAPEMLDLGFRELGRYVLKPEPVRSFGYCFQSPDGRTIGVLGSIFDDTYISFSTQFANGLALETGSVEGTPELASVNQSATYRAVFAPGLSVVEVYVRHEEAIAELEASFNTRALAFEPEQFRDVLTYENRVYSQFLFETGKYDAPPPAAVLPTPSETLALYESGDSEDAGADRLLTSV